MDSDRWRKVEELFHAAVACTGPERERVLNEACGDDEALRIEVESLLAAHGRAPRFIERPAFDAQCSLAPSAEAPVEPAENVVGNPRNPADAQHATEPHQGDDRQAAR